jgi:hypothetical protein
VAMRVVRCTVAAAIVSALTAAAAHAQTIGKDFFYAEDGTHDVLLCGPGYDTAYVDPVDTTYGCEQRA